MMSAARLKKAQSGGDQSLGNTRVHRLPAFWRHAIMPYDDKNQVSTVNAGAADAHVMRRDSAQCILQLISVRHGRSLQPVETEVAFAAVEGIERRAYPIPVEPTLLPATCYGLNELSVG